MKTRIVPISNIARLSSASEALLNRAEGSPGMGLIHGPTGYGKTTGITWLITKNHGVYVRARAVETPRSLLNAIAKELDLAARPTNVDTVEAIVERLASTGRPLFLDEADYVIDSKKMIETLRDLHDLATVPVVLIGMAGIQRRIQAREQLSGRIAQWVEFLPCTQEDVQMLSAALCEVKVDNDLLLQLHQATRGSVRLVSIGLAQIEAHAKSRSLGKIGRAQWPSDKEFFLGNAPGKPARGNLASVG
jgi:DNA transposition AAA+ family ATPase